MIDKSEYKKMEHRIRELERTVDGYKRKENSVKQNRVEMDALFTNAPLVMFIVDQDRRLIRLNKAALEMTRRLQEEVIGMRGGEALRCIHAFDDPKGCGFSDACESCVVRNTVLETFRTGKDFQSVEASIPHILENGQVALTVLVSTTLVKSDENETVLVCLNDITQRKNAEQALQDREAKFRSIFENKGTATGLFGEDSIIQECNAVFEELSGYSKSDIVGKMKWSDFVVKEDLKRLLKYHAKRSNDGSAPTQYECRIVNKKGEEKNVIVNIGMVSKTRIVSLTDITERKRAEEALKKSEWKYRSLSNNLNVGIYRNTIGKQGRFIEANPAIAEMFGYAGREDFLEQNVADLYKNPKEREAFADKLVRHGALKNVELELKRKDGTVFTGSLSAVAVNDENGDIAYFDGAIENITEQQHIRKAIITAKEEWEATFDAVSDLIVILDKEHRIKRVNRAMADKFGSSPEQMVGRTCHHCFHGTDKPLDQCPHTKLMTTGKEYKIEIFNEKLGSEFLITVSPIFDSEGGVTGSVHTAHDITDQKRKERLQSAQLRLIEYADSHTTKELLQKSLDEAEELTRSRIGFYHFLENDQETLSLQAWSSNTQKGMCSAEVAGHHYSVSKAGVWVDCIHALKPVIHNDYEGLPHRKGMPKGHAPVTRELVVPVIRGGKIVAIFGVGNKPVDYDEHDTKIVQQLADFSWEIVVRKRVESSLRVSEEKYRSMMESMKEPVYICTPDFRIEYMNQAMINRVGENAVGRRCFKALHNLSERCPWCCFDQPFNRCYEINIVSPKDGRLFNISNSPIVHENGSVSKMTIYRDVTQKKKMEAQLRQSQKMEAIGTLAGGIAHDFNNILSGIFGFSQLAEMHLDDPERVKADLKNIVKGAARATQLIEQILTFSREVDSKKQCLQLSVIVKEALKLIRSTIPATIEMKERIRSEALVFADPIQMHQVIMNLCTNAYHAMSNSGGEMAVRLDEVYRSDPDDAPADSSEREKYLEFEVSDTGHGMDENIIAKIFDPYFTTKTRGKGTGLGLSLVRGIIEDHGGTIHVNSVLGKGSTFIIHLPIVEQPRRANMENRPEAKIPKGTESVLFVDDEISIRTFMQDFLGHYGYKVTVSENGEEALKKFKQDPHKFDMVITDMTMPKMNGDQLVLKIHDIRKDLPIILCTGYSEKIDKDLAKKIGISKFIQKPIAGRELCFLIRGALDNKTGEKG